MKVLCPSPSSFSNDCLELLKIKTNLFSKELSQKQFEKIGKDFDVILIRFNFKITKKLINSSSNIKFIICPTTGLDHIDQNLCKKNKVVIISLKNETKFLQTIHSTAELTFSLILNLSRYFVPAYKSALSFKWNFQKFRGNELSGKTIGIIGYGRLGRKVSKIAEAFEMKIVFYDPFIKKYPKKIKKINSLINLLKVSDIVSLHLPLNSKTKHMISKKEISNMKKNAIIINTSRASIIKSADLIYCLKKKIIRSAGYDVLDEENNIEFKKSILINYAKKNDNLIITPHIGGSTEEAVKKTDRFVLEKFFKNYSKHK